MLYENGKEIGVASVMRAYPAADASGGEIRTPLVTAVCSSGARATFWTFLKPGDDHVASIA